VVYADADHVLCRRWNWRQDARSLITPVTTRAVVTLQSNGAGDVDAAAANLVDLIRKFSGGQCRVAILDKSRPSADL
jgi:DNA/RNA-binding domain of Phe-tRNA-synthetase-like protein